MNPNISEDEVNVYLSMLQDQMSPIMPSFSKSVVVVGAGLAGLAAARECRKAGMDVAILESGDRAGGRCFTMSSPEHFSDGVYGEAGGMVSLRLIVESIYMVVERLTVYLLHSSFTIQAFP